MRPFSSHSDAPKSRLRKLSPWANLAFLVSLWFPPRCTAATAATAADYYVKSLPGAPDGPLLKMHAGHIEVTPETNGKLFFWHYQNRHIGDRSRTVIWLNGGPGCSSMDGAMMEVGPYRVREGGKLEYNNGSWDEFANLLFVDNPVGTGFSTVDTDSYIHELDTMADQFVVFLEKWFELFPEYEGDDLYIAGESYAGEHIPYITKKILETHYGDNMGRPWNLKGILIGNGWISPVDQYPSYLKFAYKRGLVENNSNIAKQLDAQQAVCDRSLGAGGNDRVDTHECESILQKLLTLTLDSSKPANQRCINMYDVRLRDSSPSCGMNWPPDLEHVTPYLRDATVVSALNIDQVDKNTGWHECDGKVGRAFTARNSTPAINLLPDILKQVPVLLFSGDQDLICNHVGTEELIHNMQWNDAKGFEISRGTWAPRRKWTFEGEAAGIYQEARNLTYVLFYNASHMVPFDYPRRTRDMLDRFMGVDIASIGGQPADSRIDGEKGLETSVGGHPNSTAAEETQREKLQEATWNAYYKSGEVVLIIVIIAAAAWGWFVYCDRKRRGGYQGLSGSEGGGNARRGSRSSSVNGSVGLENFRHKERADVESYGDDDDFDHNQGRQGRETYSLGNLEADEDRRGSGHGQQWRYKDR